MPNFCTGCRNKLPVKDFMICHQCKRSYDLLCANISPNKFKSLSNESKINWKCHRCRNKMPKINNTNTPIIRPPLNSQVDCVLKDCGTSLDIDNVTIRSNSTKLQNDILASNSVINAESLRGILESFKSDLSTVITKNISDMITERLKDINKEISGFREAITFFNEQYEDLKKRLDDSEVTIHKLKSNNDHLNSTVNDLTKRLNLAEQFMRESNIEINGPPEHSNENLVNTFGQLAKTVNVNFSNDDIVQVTRVAKFNKENKKPRTVIARLRTPRHRDTLLAAVQNFNKKNPENKLNSH
ncbi:unnamed protein product [Danaus chrysippus]|uniref:(African queen) hypothetical protein n=1 Tax=Danaus chrysippus TaxID=151541 RepID=A0A8J2QI47_9NEOP|nr:unnamed protein product [Danaus chrysippus]